MSASLFADVIVDIKDILRALQTYDQHKPSTSTQYDRPPGLPFPIAMPVPQRTPGHFATILTYEEPEAERPASSSAVEDSYVQHKDDYLRSGGEYTQRLLTLARGTATSFRKDIYRDSTTSNEAPPWPPAPELVANPPNWGFVATTSHSGNTSEDAEMDATESDNDWSDASSQSGSLIHVFDVKGRAWDSESTSGSSSEDSSHGETDDEDENTYATGYFIGRDGTQWPMPPPECMPGGYLSTHPSPNERMGTWSPTTPTDATESLSGYEAYTSADEDVLALEAIEGRVVWSAEGYESGSSDTDFDEDERLEDDRLEYPSHLTPPLSYSVGNSPASGFAPSPTHPSAPSTPTAHLSLAELGRQWYASFGKDLQPSPSNSSPDSYAPPMSLVPPSTTAQDSCWGPPFEGKTRSGRTMRKVHHRAIEEQCYFLGRDGSAWPLPPPPPDASECGLWRPGRTVRAPRW
ncbi:uncharacterized protein TRAVEDRAFT_22110 [Trametes versicolor FP-101664 SS1]|uniref:uncharacterized protein n=1 Tax=Trametes versicolor (strain FP-101664) TaxID=717944 RepID=UPI0004624749|nr:uncharacterized protein TRAVEDRAFT_22110 [Trametes versicolor FP-101664 SS1]EIW55615.1 hypothetical protein TRAVEDRAFT_22110 [Trametes versicolor FP-101664 SS1]